MSKTKHIVLICSRLDTPGGTEKAVVSFSGLLAANGHRVTLLVLDKIAASFYPIPTGVSVQYEKLLFGLCPGKSWLGRKSDFVQSIRRLRKLWRQLKPNVIIATDYPFVVATVLSGGRKYAKCFSWEHHAYDWLKKSAWWNRLLRFAYPRMNGVVVVNESEAKHYQQFCRKVHVIPNFVTAESTEISSLDEKTILTVGWLIYRKGIDLLLPAAKIVFSKHPDWKWKIIGKGEKEADVRKFIHDNGLEENLILQPPFSDNLIRQYKQASIFVLPARIEVFGLVLIEAMNQGVPCIALAKADGPAGIIQHEEDGLLVAENPSDLANAVLKLMEDKMVRKQYGQNALQNVKRFAPERIYAEWEKIL